MDTVPGPPKLHVLGVTDEQTTCDRCGRTELHGTVILANPDGTEAARVGTTCASTILGRNITRQAANGIEAARRGTALRAMDAITAAVTRADLTRLFTAVNDLRAVMTRDDETVAWYEGLRARMELGDLHAKGLLATP